MKSGKLLLISFMLLALSGLATEAWAQITIGNAFTYQGFLMERKKPANDLYDFQFGLYDDPCVGQQVGLIVSANDVDVTDGHFTVVVGLRRCLRRQRPLA